MSQWAVVAEGDPIAGSVSHRPAHSPVGFGLQGSLLHHLRSFNMSGHGSSPIIYGGPCVRCRFTKPCPHSTAGSRRKLCVTTGGSPQNLWCVNSPDLPRSHLPLFLPFLQRAPEPTCPAQGHCPSATAAVLMRQRKEPCSRAGGGAAHAGVKASHAHVAGTAPLLEQQRN